MAVLDRYLGELAGIRGRVAEESLTNIPEAERTAFGFGKAVGRLEGLRLAEETLNRVLEEIRAEERESGAGRNRNKA